MTAVGAWATSLEARRIPDPILATAPESPWRFPAEVFRHRAEHAIDRETPTPTTIRALEALPSGGTVLDVGCGTGATSLPLAASASSVVGVDASAEMLEAFRRNASSAGVDVVAIEGTWPEAAAEAPACDLVVCGHVLYNVADLAPFARALDDHARRRVVLELTDRHPLAWMNELWERFHGVAFPDGPSADDAERALREIGVTPSREDRAEHARGGFEARADAVALIRRRLCLTADRDHEVAEALGSRLHRVDDLWSAGPPEQTTATLWWDTRPT